MGDRSNLIAEIEVLRRALASSDQMVRLLKDELDLLRSRIFGKSSERLDPDQLKLFASDDTAVDSTAVEVEEVKAHKRKKKGHGRQAFPNHLQRAERICDLAEDDKHCDVCEAELRHIGDDVCERGHLIPAQIIVNRYIKRKYACPRGHGVKTAEAPAAILDRCKYEPSVYAHVVVSKFADHQPYYRQEGSLKRVGFDLPRSTMGDMVQRAVEITGDPLRTQMQIELMAEPYIQADETPITILNEGQKGSRQGYMWVYRSRDKVLFDFRFDRNRRGPSEFLREFSGVLQCDGYSGYDEIVARNNLVRAGCWSHARRKFKDALKSAKARAAPMMVLMTRLFRIESAMKKRRDLRGLADGEFHELRARVRLHRSTVVVNKIKDMLLELDKRNDVLPKSEIGKAVAYAMNQWPTLVTFLDYPIVEVDNNAAERAIRQVALGRKNWMFAGSEKGGHAAAVFYSLMGTCKVLGINPQTYLEDVLVKVSTTPNTEAHTLTPWAWAAAQPKT